MGWKNGFFVLVLLALLVFPVSAQDDPPPAPYLYYYSPLIGGFVIERADGFDSRAVGVGFSDSTQNEILAPLWSPSGRWMVWQTANYGGLGPSYYRAWGSRVDGSAQLSVLEFPRDVQVNTVVLEWSPDRDLLLAVQITQPLGQDNPPATAHYRLIDSETDGVIASHSTPFPYLQGDSREFKTVWLPDGVGVSVSARLDWEGIPVSIVTLETDASASVVDTYASEFVGMLPDGAYGLSDERGFTLYRRDGATEHYDLSVESGDSYQFSVSPDGETVLIAYHDEQLWRLDRDAQQAVPIGQRLVRDESTRIHWGTHLWSADSAYYLYTDITGGHHIYERDTDTARPLLNIPDHDSVVWADNNRQLWFYQENRVTVYDIASQESSTLQQLSNANLPDYNQLFYPSPDGQYFGTQDRRIYDGKRGNWGQISIHSAALSTSSAIYLYDWHPSAPWVIVGADVTHAGCCGPTALGVVSLNPRDSRRQRELTTLWGGAAGWLPDAIIPHLAAGQPESVTDQPESIQSYSDGLADFAWSSDGLKIALVIDYRVAVTGFNPQQASLDTPSRTPLTISCQLQSYIQQRCALRWESENLVEADGEVWNLASNQFEPPTTPNRVCEWNGNACQGLPPSLSSPDGRWRVEQPIGEATFNLVDVEDGTVIRAFSGVSDYVWTGSRLALAIDRKILLYDVLSGVETELPIPELDGYPSTFYSLSVSADGQLLAANSVISPISLWNLEAGEYLASLNQYASKIRFSPDGLWLGASSGAQLRIWDMSAYRDEAQ
ncbi:MAG: hypothetical protein MUF38_18920 [Anaerolineae bacterium]|jgi:WD40 repeat protein|nr:hypothetical protein [Anaerolineae bacterium]